MSNDFSIPWVSVYRVFRIADKLVSSGEELTRFDIHTYNHLFEQLSSVEKEHIYNKFGKNLTFLNDYKED